MVTKIRYPCTFTFGLNLVQGGLRVISHKYIIGLIQLLIRLKLIKDKLLNLDLMCDSRLHFAKVNSMSIDVYNIRVYKPLK